MARAFQRLITRGRGEQPGCLQSNRDPWHRDPDQQTDLLNVESGVNDGLALTFVLISLTLASGSPDLNRGALAGELAIGRWRGWFGSPGWKPARTAAGPRSTPAAACSWLEHSHRTSPVGQGILLCVGSVDGDSAVVRSRADEDHGPNPPGVGGQQVRGAAEHRCEALPRPWVGTTVRLQQPAVSAASRNRWDRCLHTWVQIRVSMAGPALRLRCQSAVIPVPPSPAIEVPRSPYGPLTSTADAPPGPGIRSTVGECDVYSHCSRS